MTPSTLGQPRPEPLSAAAVMSLARSFTIVGSAALTSRITGFVRDMLVAAVLGAGAVADAYVAAFLIPNLFRRLVGEGAFNAAYVPIFARRRAEGGAPSAQAFAEAALSVMLGLGLLAVLAAEFLMPALIGAVAPGFTATPDKFADAVAFGRILIPFVAVILLVAVFTATLNALNRFAVAAWTPVLLNLLLIATLLYALAQGSRGTRDAGFLLAGTLLAAGVLNLAIVAAAAWRSGMPLRPQLRWPDSDVRRLMWLALPGIALAGAGHINIVAAAQMASGAPSAVAWLYFAERIFQLPLGFVAAAVGVVLLPAVSRHLAGGDGAAAREAESRALELALLVTLPAATALALLSGPIVNILYERGAFGPADTLAVARMLQVLALGLPAFVMAQVLLQTHLAREEMKGPLLAALAGLAANVAAVLILLPRLGPVAAAIGVSVSAAVNAGVLAVMVWRQGRFRLDGEARHRLPRVFLACLLTGAVIVALNSALGRWLDGGNVLGVRILALAALCGGTLLFHAIAAHLLRAADFGRMLRSLRDRKATTGPSAQ